jgi:hypothetical protein
VEYYYSITPRGLKVLTNGLAGGGMDVGTGKEVVGGQAGSKKGPRVNMEVLGESIALTSNILIPLLRHISDKKYSNNKRILLIILAYFPHPP